MKACTISWINVPRPSPRFVVGLPVAWQLPSGVYHRSHPALPHSRAVASHARVSRTRTHLAQLPQGLLLVSTSTVPDADVSAVSDDSRTVEPDRDSFGNPAVWRTSLRSSAPRAGPPHRCLLGSILRAAVHISAVQGCPIRSNIVDDRRTRVRRPARRRFSYAAQAGYALVSVFPIPCLEVLA
jgi:hypothetical protein